MGIEPESWRNAAYWLVPRSLFSLLSYISQDSLAGRVTAHHEVGLLTLIINHANAHKLVQRSMW